MQHRRFRRWWWLSSSFRDRPPILLNLLPCRTQDTHSTNYYPSPQIMLQTTDIIEPIIDAKSKQAHINNRTQYANASLIFQRTREGERENKYYQ